MVVAEVKYDNGIVSEIGTVAEILTKLNANVVTPNKIIAFYFDATAAAHVCIYEGR